MEKRDKPQEQAKLPLKSNGSRQYTVEVGVGTTGSGKTFKTKQVCDAYLKYLKLPVLIFDVNGEYTKYTELLEYDVNIEDNFKRGEVIRKFCKSKPFIGRITVMKKDSSNPKRRVPMNIDEMKKTYQTIADNFVGGLLVLDDIIAYEKGFRSDKAAGIANRLRHGKDLMLNFQKISYIQTVLWGAIKYIRMHKLSDDPYKVKERIPDIIPIQVAYLVIEQNYKEGYDYITKTLCTTTDMYAQDLKDEPKKYSKSQKEQANKIYKSFTIRINPMKIENITKEEFDKGLDLYFRKYEPTEIKRSMNYHKCSQEEALLKLIEENQHYRE